MYGTHRYLLEGDLLHEEEKNIFLAILNKKSDQSTLEIAIKQLSGYMKRKFNKAPIILIDEYDTPIQEAYLQNYYPQMIELMRGILGQALKDNPSLGKAILTGIARVGQESLFSGLNNLSVYTLLREKYGQYFGFSEEEVIRLFSKANQSTSIDTIKDWYNGYQIGKYTLYNPWSIISCIDHNGLLKPYWLNTGGHGLLSVLFAKAGPKVKEGLEKLLQGKSIKQEIHENLVFPEIDNYPEALWSFLLYVGYLKVLSYEVGEDELVAEMTIPNKEVSRVYKRIVKGWFRLPNISIEYDKFVNSLAIGDMQTFKAGLSEYIIQTVSYFDFEKNIPEQIFHIFILGLVAGLRDSYYINSNQESGLGRCDVTFIPKNKNSQGIILEFKTSERAEELLDKAQTALEQIKERRYVEKFKQAGIDSVLAVGMAFCGKQLDLVHENIDIRKN